MVGSGSAGGDLRTPQFNGSNYDYWSVKMETILIAYDLWDAVEIGIQPQPILSMKQALKALEMKRVRLSKFQWKHLLSPEKIRSKMPRL
ncbi:hypothetical protein L3X38_009598 [Prunus dulcis]|uniref:DUF4219 domain-containing protein n=1 Tax=Prunus dulcis TaxID=3755 RepID=A0AAD4ZE12_PRUDU|nr:hypothetical protein L3X38_009598 [Prunus dulcis]